MIDNIMNNIYGRSFGTNSGNKNSKKISLNIDDYIKSYAEVYSIDYKIKANITNTHIQVKELLKKGHSESEILNNIKTASIKVWEFIKNIFIKCIKFIKQFIAKITKTSLDAKLQKCKVILNKIKKYCIQNTNKSSSEALRLTDDRLSYVDKINDKNQFESRTFTLPLLILPAFTKNDNTNDVHRTSIDSYLNKYLTSGSSNAIISNAMKNIIQLHIRDLPPIIALPTKVDYNIKNDDIIQKYNKVISDFDTNYINNFDTSSLNKLDELSRILLKSNDTYRPKNSIDKALNNYISDNSTPNDSAMNKIFEYIVRTIKFENTYEESTKSTKAFINFIKDKSIKELTFEVDITHSGAVRLVYEFEKIYQETYVSYLTSLNTNNKIMLKVFATLSKLQQKIVENIVDGKYLKDKQLTGDDVNRIIRVIGDSTKTITKMINDNTFHIAKAKELADILYITMEGVYEMFKEVGGGK